MKGSIFYCFGGWHSGHMRVSERCPLPRWVSVCNLVNFFSPVDSTEALKEMGMAPVKAGAFHPVR